MSKSKPPTWKVKLSIFLICMVHANLQPLHFVNYSHDINFILQKSISKFYNHFIRRARKVFYSSFIILGNVILGTE